MEKVSGDPDWVWVFHIFSRLHHYISLILHKIAAWDNILPLVEQKPPKKIWGWNWSRNDLFYSTVLKHPLKLACFCWNQQNIFKKPVLSFLEIFCRDQQKQGQNYKKATLIKAAYELLPVLLQMVRWPEGCSRETLGSAKSANACHLIFYQCQFLSMSA